MPRTRRSLLISSGLALGALPGCQQLGADERSRLGLLVRNYTDREQPLKLELLRRDESTRERAMVLDADYRVPAPDSGQSAGTIRRADIAPERRYLVRVLLKNGRFERFHAHYYPTDPDAGAIDFGLYRDEPTETLFVDFRSLS